MTAKTSAQRFNDANLYLSQSINSGLALHLAQLLVASPDHVARYEQLGKDMSLKGARTWLHSSSENKNNALRALILCRDVYLSPLWAKYYPDSVIGEPGGAIAVDYRGGPTMAADVIAYWKDKSEREIGEAIRMYLVRPNARATDLLEAAATNPGSSAVNSSTIELTRKTDPFMGGTSCYGAVINWLVLSGITSLRWLVQADVNPNSLLALLGQGDVWIKPIEPVVPGGTFPVPAGMIVNFFDPASASQGGHWVVSDGTGGGYGANNDNELGTKNTLYDHITLRGQLDGFRRAHNGKGGMRVIDPMAIPGRL